MTLLLSLLLALFPAHSSGVLSYYDAEPTQATVEVRQSWGHIPDDLSGYDVLLAVPDCGRVGHEAILVVGSDFYKALVFDCGGDDGGHDWMIDNGIVAEVDWDNRGMVWEKAVVVWVN